MEKVEVVKTKLRKVPIDTILIGDRFRKDVELDENFLNSVEVKGILQPITLNGKLHLVAGGRRLAAAIKLKHKTIPALVRDTEDELDLRECELLENSMRKDLHWVDQVKLTNRIHNLLQEKYGGDLAKGWGQPRTAEVINRSVGGINRHVQMAKYLEMFPQLSECPTEDEAVKTVRKLIEKVQVKQMVTEHHERLAQTSDEEIKKIEDPRIRNAMSAKTHYTVGDALAGMKQMTEDGLKPPIALVEVDPPYGIDLKDKKKGMVDTKLNKYEEIDSETYPLFLFNTAYCIYNCIPKDCRIIWWFGIEWYQEVYDVLTNVGFSVDKIPCIWTKPAGQSNSPELYLARCYEPFFVATKGDGIPIRQRGRSNIFQFPTVPAARKYHPTQRPVELMREILRTFSYPGSIILSPFLGSGATLRAIYAEGMMGWGWDLNGDNYEPFLAAVEKDIQDYTSEGNKQSSEGVVGPSVF